ncbi:hypothetical protein AAFC00_000116 [Neodothiora populina]|uniref:Hsp90 chaperone protein kinase-targeting subunit n=1 Tax=Neodothiora populina TaxID=2781224 RepID=A0ABR3P1T4_9PEZI
MPVDYSKWDNLELSDDSDIEVHPNVDKRSFIRAKQSQIHQERLSRKHQIETLKYEKIINDGLLSRIDGLLESLESHKERAEQGASAESLVFEALMANRGSQDKDTPPTPPPGIHAGVEQPSYTKMMAALVDQCKTAVDKTNPTDGRYQAFVTEITSHYTKVDDLQKELLKKLAELQKEEKSKITSESIHTGFDSSFVSKSAPSASKSSEPELLNPSRPSLASAETGQSSGADGDIEEGSIVARAPANADSDDEDMQASPVAKKFAKIRFGDYRSSLEFISKNLEVLGEKNTDGLLVEAFSAQTDHKDDYARQCVHQALLLQYCRQLGKDGVQLFFKRIMTPGHQAQKLFMDDVNTTYARIRSRCRELEEQSKRDEAEGTGGVEQIQLHAVDPNTTIHIQVPPADSSDEDTKQARQIFETFPAGLQRALESGSLDRVNEVLGKMSLDEAEEVVGLLGNAGMLSMEEGVIDATTDEGRKQMEEIERTGRFPGQGEEQGTGHVVEEYEDPGMD